MLVTMHWFLVKALAHAINILFCYDHLDQWSVKKKNQEQVDLTTILCTMSVNGEMLLVLLVCFLC